MAKPERTGRKLIDFLRSEFALVGEEVVRASSGSLVEPTHERLVVHIGGGYGGLQYHRLKFALAHGWLPDEVDHRDRDRMNNRLANLRPATRQQQGWNQSRTRTRHKLPRGVYHSGRRFRAMLQVGGKLQSLGSYDTPAEASAVVEAKARELHGEFYNAQS